MDKKLTTKEEIARLSDATASLYKEVYNISNALQDLQHEVSHLSDSIAVLIRAQKESKILSEKLAKTLFH